MYDALKHRLEKLNKRKPKKEEDEKVRASIQQFVSSSPHDPKVVINENTISVSMDTEGYATPRVVFRANTIVECCYFEVTLLSVASIQEADALLPPAFMVSLSHTADSSNSVRIVSNGTKDNRPPPLSIGDTLGVGVTTTGKTFLTLNGQYLGTPKYGFLTVPAARDRSDFGFGVELYVYPGVMIKYSLGRQTPFMFNPDMPREVTTDVLGNESSPLIHAVVCGPMISSSQVNPNTFQLRNMSPYIAGMACAAGRESQVQFFPLLSLKRSHPYFEVRVDELPGDTTVAIGLTNKYLTKESYHGLPGWCNGELGYHSDDGMIYSGAGTSSHGVLAPFGKGDVVGCGVDNMFRVFFTKNGQRFPKILQLPADFTECCFTVGLDKGTAMTVTLEPPYMLSFQAAPITAADASAVPRPRAIMFEGFNDILAIVMGFLRPNELLQAARTSIAFHDAAMSDHVWSPHYFKRHGSTRPDPQTNYFAWYYHYVNAQKKEQLEKMRRMEEDFHQSSRVCAKKPVVYLYTNGTEGSVHNVEITVSLTESSTMSYMYPQPTSACEKSNKFVWRDLSIWVDGDGHADNNTTTVTYEGVAIPYVFWEADVVSVFNVKDVLSTHSITSDDIAVDGGMSTLGRAVQRHGLRGVEVSDFVTYWLPQLQQQYFSRGVRCVTASFVTSGWVDENIGSLDVVIPGSTTSPLREGYVHRVYVLFSAMQENDAINTNHNHMDDDQKVSRLRLEMESENVIFAVEWGGVMM